jgi:hypothetical protein
MLLTQHVLAPACLHEPLHRGCTLQLLQPHTNINIDTDNYNAKQPKLRRELHVDNQETLLFSTVHIVFNFKL